MDDYPHCTLGEDGWLRTTGRHRPGFPRLLLDALVRIGYDGPIPEYRCRPFQKHGLACCEVRVEIPVDPETPWTGTVVGGDLDESVERMAHLALTALCEQRLPDTAGLAIALYPIRDQDEPEWQQRLEAICDVTRELFHAGWAQMAKYARYMFNLQIETTRIVAAQRTRMNEYERLAITADLHRERLERENHALRQGACSVRGRDQELQSLYRRLSEVERELNHTRTQLQQAREEVDIRTHAIVHLEHHVEQQDAELEAREEEITNLFHQVLDLQNQLPPAPEEDPEEAEPMSEVDDD
jgi:hypothetical protein